MEKNNLLKYGDTVLRVLEVKENTVLAIDCINRTTPKKYFISELSKCEKVSENELSDKTHIHTVDVEELEPDSKRYPMKDIL